MKKIMIFGLVVIVGTLFGIFGYLSSIDEHDEHDHSVEIEGKDMRLLFWTNMGKEDLKIKYKPNNKIIILPTTSYFSIFTLSFICY